jgi:hypothetical protein
MKRHLSPSQLGMLTRCGLQYEYRYVKGLKRPPGIAAYVGTGTHRSVEANMQSVIDTKIMIPKEHALDVARDAVEAEWTKEPPLLSPEEKSLPLPQLRGQSIDGAVSLAALHYDNVAPGIEPLHVERKFTLSLHGFPFDFMGVIDIQEPKKIRDTKTRSKSPSQQEADSSLQLTAYHMGVQILEGKAPEIVQLDALVSTKVPKAVHLSSTRTVEDHHRLLRRLEYAAQAIELGAFLPAPEDSWICSEAHCGYWDMCPFGSKGRSKPQS